jgi:septum formation protein
LADAGLPAEVIVSGVDESIVDDDRPDALCLTLARLKAEAVAAQLRRDGAAGVLVLGCDSVLGFDNRILGKPADPAEATARWHAMRGKSGVLYTGHCLIHLPAPAGPTPATPGSDATAPGSGATTPGGDPVTVAAVAATTVHFADISDAEIDAYVRTGEPLAVAGAFTLDGRSSPFVESIEGDPGTVIGLSLPLLRRLLAELGIPITSLWATR